MRGDLQIDSRPPVRSSHLRDLSDEDFKERYSCDRFTASVLGSRCRYLVKHMCVHLMRNAFSPILRDGYDFAATLSGPPRLGYPLSAVSDGILAFTGTMCDAVRNTVEEFGPDELRPGDVLICNDPVRTGTHVNDLLFTRPVFYDGEIIGFLNLQPHMIDMGGTVPGGFSPNKRNTYENGLVIPPTLLFREDRPVRSAFSLIFDNARFGDVMLPDMLTVAADLRLGEGHLLRAVTRYGVDAYIGALAYATDVSAEAMSEAILALPDGVYEGEDMIDCDGVDASESYYLRVKVIVAGARLEVDLSGSSRQARTCINSGWLDTKSAIAAALKILIEPKSHYTSGVFRHLDVVVPQGSIACAMPPDGAIMLYWESSASLMIAMYRAFERTLGPRAVAGDFATSMLVNANGHHPDGTPWTVVAATGGEQGPWGATSHGDANNSLNIPLGNSIAPAVEAIESSVPVVILRKEYAMDTAGAGFNRGGAATQKDTLWLTEGDHQLCCLHLRKPSGIGVFGGGAGTAGGAWLWPGDAHHLPFLGNDDETYRSAEPVAGVVDRLTGRLDLGGHYYHYGRREVWRVAPGARWRFQTNAGGGWGDPLERDPERVLRDVRDEYVSSAAARATYGVVVIGDPLLDPEALVVDADATSQLRVGLRARQVDVAQALNPGEDTHGSPNANQ